jgi:hypothetical protein
MSEVCCYTSVLIAFLVCAAAGFGLVNVHWWVDRQVESLLQRVSHVHCTLPEDDVEYVTGRALYDIHNISSPQICRGRCRGAAKCRAWTWKKRQDITGLTSVCSLKELDKGHVPQREFRQGAVSGMNCPTLAMRGGNDSVKDPDCPNCGMGGLGGEGGLPGSLGGADAGWGDLKNTLRGGNSQRRWPWSHPADRPSRRITPPPAPEAPHGAHGGRTGDTDAHRSETRQGHHAPEEEKEKSTTAKESSPETAVAAHHGRHAKEATTVTNTTTSATSTTEIARQTLFCFSVMLPDSYETSLLLMQHEKEIGIFACDGRAIYSNRLIKVAPGAITRVVDSDLKCKLGGKFHTAMNTDIFLAVWEKVYTDGQFWAYRWTVKVDPDTVFFPSRLVPILEGLKEGPKGTYLNNCKYGLHGPIEIFSRNAVQAFEMGVHRCKQHFHHACKGPCLWGEDKFIDQCLWKVLGVKRQNSFRILLEDHCDPPDNWDQCHDHGMVAFHPFKDAAAYGECVDNSLTASRQDRQDKTQLVG